MAIKTLEQRKKQKTLLFAALGIIIIAFLIFYFGFLKKGVSTPAPAIEPGAEGIEEQGATTAKEAVLESRLKKVDLNIDFLTKTILPFLKVHGNLPVEKGTTGRPNPFSP